MTTHLGPDQIVAFLSVDLDDSLSGADIASSITALEDKIRRAHPQVAGLFIKPQSSATWEARRAAIAGTTQPGASHPDAGSA